VLDLKPKVVYILSGVNDIAGNTGLTSMTRIEGDIMSMVQQARAKRIEVVLGSVTPAAGFSWRPAINPVGPISELDAWLKAYAGREGLQFVDYYSPPVDENHGFKKQFTVGGVHPNYAGYKIMEPLAMSALQSALHTDK
jgi:lysophospholipase L1-like esterase